MDKYSTIYPAAKVFFKRDTRVTTDYLDVCVFKCSDFQMYSLLLGLCFSYTESRDA